MASAVRVMAWLLVMAAAGHAQTPNVDVFLTELQRASQANDRNTIAALIRYPITISIGGLRVPFADAAGFLERYDDIFNAPLREAIARGSAIDTRFIAVDSVEGQLRITAITVPQFASGESAAVGPPADAPKGTTQKQQPRRVTIRVGPRPTQVPGLLAQGATDSVILYLPKGRLASVRLERVPAGAAVIRVVHAATGVPLAARTSTDGRFVSGRPPENGDYRIEVRRTDKTDEAHLPYMLSLSLR
jgi:hypothetical protein